MSTLIEKVEHGYVVQHGDWRSIESAEHVANLILMHWHDVAAAIRAKLRVPPLSAEEKP